jgi:glycosyltransferase 2 family protein
MRVKPAQLLRSVATVALLALTVYFYSFQVAENWSALRSFRPSFNTVYLLLAPLLYVAAYIVDTYAWQFCMNMRRRGLVLNFQESLAVFHSSNLLKYVPGRIWSYTAQMVWLRKYGIPRPVILFVNLISIVASMVVSVYFGLVYLLAYRNQLSTVAIVAALTLFTLLNIAFIRWNAPVLNRFIILLARLLKREIEPLQHSSSLIILMELAHVTSWSLIGVGTYALAQGVGLHIAVVDLFAVVASLAISWMLGYLAFILPAGLGVREVTMFWMLRGIADPQVTLMFPVLSRLMDLLMAALLGAVAMYIGVKRGVFSSGSVPGTD